jgi:cysteine desulfurase
MIYLDNNATTIMPAQVIAEMTKWCNLGNPSASYQSAARSRKMMENLRKYIAKACDFSVCCPEGRDVAPGATAEVAAKRANPAEYKVIFTSGASESNATIIHAVLLPYLVKSQRPHMVVSAVEHKSILDMVRKYEELGAVEVSWIAPIVSGHILARDVQAAIRENTALVCIMHANNETGAVNDIGAIGAIARKYGVPFHSDTVQTFGKCPVQPNRMFLDSFSISFHKVHGPAGVGALVVRQAFVEECALTPLIYGSQNEGMRGGTENVPGLAAAFAGLYYTFGRRDAAATTLGTLKKVLLTDLSKVYPIKPYAEYVSDGARPTGITIVVLSGVGDNYLPNTILLSVVRKSGPAVCNAKIKAELEKKKMIVAVGSACNTASPKASHVLYAMGADEYVRRGALRISMGTATTLADIRAFVAAFVGVLAKH